jgi:hypothetical protein
MIKGTSQDLASPKSPRAIQGSGLLPAGQPINKSKGLSEYLDQEWLTDKSEPILNYRYQANARSQIGFCSTSALAI